MEARVRVEHPVSAGGVVYRLAGREVEVVICGRHGPQGWKWALPKGTPELGENMEETAMREVTEETGLEVDLVSPIDKIQYWFVQPVDGMKCHKTVHFYLMAPVGGSVSEHDIEFDAVRWAPGEEALRVLSYHNEVTIMEKALKIVACRAAQEGAVD